MSNARLRWGVLFILAFAIRAWGCNFGLPATYHPDEHQYVDAGLDLLGGDLNPHQFNNPSLFKYVLGGVYLGWGAIARLTGGVSSLEQFRQWAQLDPGPAYLVARLLVAMLGAGLVLATAVVAKQAYGSRAGWLAGAILAITYIAVRESHFAVNDIPAALLSTLTVLVALQVQAKGQPRDYLLAGALAGLAAATKYTAGLVLVTLVVAHFTRFTQPGARWFALKNSVWLLAGIAVTGLVFLAGTPFAILDWPTFAADVSLLASRGQGGFKDLQLIPTSGWQFYGQTLAWGLGWPLLAAALLGLALAVKRHESRDVLLLAYPILLYVYLSPQLLAFGRFILPAVPLLVVLAARVLLRAPYLVYLSLLILPAVNSLHFDLLLTQPDTRDLAQSWIEAHIPPGTRILAESYAPELAGGDAPALGAQVTYSLTQVSTTTLPKRSLDEWIQRGYQVVITSSFSSDRVHLDASLTAQRRAWYMDLAQRGKLLAIFDPYRPGESQPFAFDQIYGPATDLWRYVRPGPVVQVYQISSQLAIR